jgi:hypothetical protein
MLQKSTNAVRLAESLAAEKEMEESESERERERREGVSTPAMKTRP